VVSGPSGAARSHLAFALKNAGLDAFLFAEVGTEANGMPLTVLSVLARLDHDPWAEAAALSRLPRAAAIERLAASIERMTLPQADARATATRLLFLLPAATPRVEPAQSAIADVPTLPGWRPLALFALFLALGIVVNLIHMPVPTALAPAPVAHVAAHSGLT
jgi:hypothetical protein